MPGTQTVPAEPEGRVPGTWSWARQGCPGPILHMAPPGPSQKTVTRNARPSPLHQGRKHGRDPAAPVPCNQGSKALPDRGTFLPGPRMPQQDTEGTQML